MAPIHPCLLPVSCLSPSCIAEGRLTGLQAKAQAMWLQRLQQTRRLPKQIQQSGGSLTARGQTPLPQQLPLGAEKPQAGWILSSRSAHYEILQYLSMHFGSSCKISRCCASPPPFNLASTVIGTCLVGVANSSALRIHDSMLTWPNANACIECIHATIFSLLYKIWLMLIWRRLLSNIWPN